MTNEPGTSTATEPDQPVDAELVGARPGDPAGGDGAVVAPGATVLGVLAVAWLAAMLWSTRSAVESAEAGATAITLSAYALPGVISAALVAGAAVALAVANVFARRWAERSTLRFATATGVGLLVGSLAALVVTLTYADTSAATVLSGTTAAAATIGGAVAGSRDARVAGAITTSGLSVLVFLVAFSFLRDPLFTLFGAGDSQASQVSAADWVSRTESLLAGLVAGLLAFGYLHRARRRALRRDPDAVLPRWPGYLIAGAGAGLLLLLTEVIIRVGGRSLIDLASALSEADQVAQTSLGTSRVDNGIWVLFVGAIAAIIALGRTLGPAPAEEDDEQSVDRAGAGIGGAVGASRRSDADVAGAVGASDRSDAEPARPAAAADQDGAATAGGGSASGRRGGDDAGR